MRAAVPGPDPEVAATAGLVDAPGVAAGATVLAAPVLAAPVLAAPVPAATGHYERRLALAELIIARSQDAGPHGGARLPTERQLSIDLGVTRSSVRSALALLEAQGRISREVGRGTFLRAHAGPSRLPDRSDAAGVGSDAANRRASADFAPADVMTIRRLLEPPAMVLVVAWATAADLEAMDRCLELGDRAATFEEFEACDLALHRCIMAGSHSPLLVSLYAAIEAARHGQVWGDLKRRRSSPERRSQYQADHRAIVEALHSRDSGGAVEAMRLHLARVQEHLNVSDPAAGLTWR